MTSRTFNKKPLLSVKISLAGLLHSAIFALYCQVLLDIATITLGVIFLSGRAFEYGELVNRNFTIEFVELSQE